MVEKESYLESDFGIIAGDVDLRAMQCIKEYLYLFNLYVVRGGNELNTPKFLKL